MIKSKKIRRLVSVVLVLVLALQFVFAASAASSTVEWYENGYEMTATVMKSTIRASREKPIPGTAVDHEIGTDTYFSRGMYTVSDSEDWARYSNYESHVLEAGAFPCLGQNIRIWEALLECGRSRL